VFYRTNAKPGHGEHLLRAGIPFKVWWEPASRPPEIKTRLAYLKAVVNPADEVRSNGILNIPRRHGDSSVAKLERRGPPCTATLHAGAARADEAGTRVGRSGPSRLLSVIDNSAQVADRALGPARVRTEPLGYLDDCSRALDRGRGPVGEPVELVGSAREAESVDVFLEQVSLVADSDQIPTTDSQVVS